MQSSDQTTVLEHSLARAMAIAPPEIEAMGLAPDRLAERITLTGAGACQSGTLPILLYLIPCFDIRRAILFS